MSLPLFAGYALVNLLLAGGVLALAAGLGLRLAPQRFHRGRYWTAVACFLAAALGPLAYTAAGGSRGERPGESPVSTPAGPERARSAGPPAHGEPVRLDSEETEAALALLRQALADGDAAAVKTLQEALGGTAAPSTPPVTPQAEDTGPALLAALLAGPAGRLLVLLWAAGALLLLTREAGGHLLLARRRRRWQGADESVKARLGCPPRVELYLGVEGSPQAFGLWRPGIYLPAGLLAALDAARIERLLRHELAHLRWRDPLVQAALRLVRALLWPAPPLWYLERLVRREREAAADREALSVDAAGPELRPSTAAYAETLLAVALGSGGHRGSAALPEVGAAGDLEERVRRLFAALRPASPLRLPAAACLLLAGLLAAALLPLPAVPVAAGAGTASGLDAGADREGWTALDRLLGRNPEIRVVVAPETFDLRTRGLGWVDPMVDRLAPAWRPLLSLLARPGSGASGPGDSTPDAVQIVRQRVKVETPEPRQIVHRIVK